MGAASGVGLQRLSWRTATKLAYGD